MRAQGEPSELASAAAIAMSRQGVANRPVTTNPAQAKLACEERNIAVTGQRSAKVDAFHCGTLGSYRGGAGSSSQRGWPSEQPRDGDVSTEA